MEKAVREEIVALLTKERQVRKIRQAMWALDGIMGPDELRIPRMFVSEMTNEIAQSPIFIAAREVHLDKLSRSES